MRNRDAVCAFVEGLAHETREWLVVLYVAEDLRLLSIETVAVGSVSGVDVPIGRIIHRGLLTGASGFILVHNHPSGDPTPSRADIDVTIRLARTAEEMDLHMLSHLVIARDGVRTVANW